MKRFLLSLIALVFVTFVAQSQIILIQDNFDTYTVGQKLSVVNPTNWQTWSNQPGGPEDPVISNEQSFSTPNSVKITGTNDIVLLLQDKTSGKYNVRFKMYIPTNNLGYFNLLQDFAGNNSQWGMQVFFNLGGIGSVDGNGQGAATFTFSYNTWIDIKTFVDLDNDWCKLFINNNLIHEYQWSKGTFGNGTLKKLDGMNLYAWAQGGTPLYYADNVVFEQVTETLITEDFESYTAGQKLVQQALAQGKNYWTTWSNQPGGPEDPVVSSDFSVSGTRSVLIQGVNDAVMLLGGKTAGAYTIEFKTYIPQGFLGYFNLLQHFAGNNSEWAIQVYFDIGGIGTVDAGGQGAAVFNYPYNTWFPVKVNVDLNNDVGELYVNNNFVVTWVWSTGTFGTGNLKKLDALNLYAWAQGGTPKAYYDDIVYIQTAPPAGPPVIQVTPTSFTETLQAGQTSQKTMNIKNNGNTNLTYSILVSFMTEDGFAGGGLEPKSTSAQTQIVEPEIPVSADEIGSVVVLDSQQAPMVPDDEVWLNYDGPNNSAIGLTNGGTFEVAARFPASMVGQYIGMQVTQVQVYINNLANSFKLKIYGQDLPNKPGQLLYEQVFSPAANSWHTINLLTPLTNTGGDLWVGYEIVQNTPSTYPAGCDAGPAHPDGDWIKTGASWAKLSQLNPSLNYNWNIRAKLVGNPMQAWLTANPSNGTVQPNQTQAITLNFSAANLSQGTYQAQIKISSNDPATPLVTVPVTLTVTGSGPQLTTVAQLDFESVPDWSMTFNPWIVIDVDQLPTYGFSNYSFPNMYQPMAYIAFNPATTTPPMTDPQIQPHGGARFGASMASTSAPWNNDWLISPKVQLGTQSKLTIWVKSYTAQYGLERYKIGVSTTTPTPNAFTIISPGAYLTAPATNWEQKVFDLSAYDNQQVHVGIQCVSQDAFVFMVDDIKIETYLTIGVDEKQLSHFTVYPNPASDFALIKSTEEMKQYRLMNYTGQVVLEGPINSNELRINTQDLPSGIYFIQVESLEGWSTQKLIVR